MERVIDMTAAELVRERPPSAAEDVHFATSLVRTVVEEYSKPGDVVLDPFAGYGTTLVVGQALGRVALGIELLGDRVELARARLGPGSRVFEGDARNLDRFAWAP